MEFQDVSLATRTRRSRIRGNPYFIFSRRPIREARLRAYITREHRRGRPLTEILTDPYVRRCGNEHFCLTVLEDPRTLKALRENYHTNPRVVGHSPERDTT